MWCSSCTWAPPPQVGDWAPAFSSPFVEYVVVVLRVCVHACCLILFMCIFFQSVCLSVGQFIFVYLVLILLIFAKT